MRLDLLGLSREELARLLVEEIDRPFRVDQLFTHLYSQGLGSFDQMITLSRTLRDQLDAKYRIGHLSLKSEHQSNDGTRKLLFELEDAVTIETVDIPDPKRRTLCLSSQAGCALACQFCVTGYWGAGRNLTAGEIVAQVLGARGRLSYGESVNLVFMGMGEPLLNLAAVKQALDVLTDAISWRRITVSTVGILPGLEEMASWPKRPNLAISLHAPDDQRRSQLMPVNLTYPLAELMQLLRKFPLERGRRITFEYVLIDGFNDHLDDALALVSLLRSVPGKVNLIPVNADPVLGEEMVPPPKERTQKFAELLRNRGVFTTIRKRRGDDVSAACGQLRAQDREPRGFRRSNLRF